MFRKRGATTMNPYPHKFSPERYLTNKAYFDSGLIALLERQQSCLDKAKKKEEIYKATIAQQKDTIKILRFKMKDKDSVIYSLNKHIKSETIDAEEIIKNFQNELEEISKTVDNELQKSYEHNTKLHDENLRLKEELEKLRKQQKRITKLNSTNSSMPSSSDGYFIPVNMREKSTLKKGGQTGHKAHLSKLNDRPTRVIEKQVKCAPQGAQPITNEEGDILYYRTQEIDMVLTNSICETRYYIKETAQALSKEELDRYAINSSTYTPHFISMVLYLNNKGDIAIERLCQMIREMSDEKIELKPSTISKWMKRFAEQSIKEQEAILDKILKSQVVHVDETGWKVNGKNAWAHTLTTKECAYFVITKKRKDEETGPLKLLRDYRGVLDHDHYKPYLTLECMHAECNAHILRYLKAGVEGYDDLGCMKMIQLLQNMNHQKKELIQAGKNEFASDTIERFEEEYLEIANDTILKYNKKYPGIAKKYIPNYIKTMKRLIEYRNEHLLFCHDFNVPFDNNAAERQMRAVKVKKKISGQSNSIETANHFAAILTVMQTCKLQNKNTLKAIEDILLS